VRLVAPWRHGEEEEEEEEEDERRRTSLFVFNGYMPTCI
jgi:hypothetical protein